MQLFIFTEDSGTNRYQVTGEVIRQSCALICPGALRDKITIHCPENAKAFHGTQWKAPRNPAGPQLLRTIANLVAQNKFVFCHVDGDRVWAQAATSENQAKIREFILKIRQILQAPPAASPRGKKGPAAPATAVVLEHYLFSVVPFYSIEAWLYHPSPATEALIEQLGIDWYDALRSWTEDPGKLDEIEKPKDLSPGPQDKYALELAQGLRGQTLERMVAANKSYAAFVRQLQNSPPLRAALQKLIPPWQWQP